jgi:hypothetical protein
VSHCVEMLVISVCAAHLTSHVSQRFFLRLWRFQSVVLAVLLVPIAY